jgi:hypothetical protein
MDHFNWPNFVSHCNLLLLDVDERLRQSRNLNSMRADESQQIRNVFLVKDQHVGCTLTTTHKTLFNKSRGERTNVRLCSQQTRDLSRCKPKTMKSRHLPCQRQRISPKYSRPFLDLSTDTSSSDDSNSQAVTGLEGPCPTLHL